MNEEKKQCGPEDEATVYDRVVLAAQEARRLNRLRFLRGMEGDAKVTTEALRAVMGDEVEWVRDGRVEPLNVEVPFTDEENSFAD
ncbi:MAG: hypothetical protein JW958_02870 [Candidatus Eisenbacteria bacterium]|nr:hypothetical protein [Candidatus Eisenbacteria bacterium]